jgi:3-dehydroquinate dehydratase/shikimate dehydrogenase
MSEGPVICAVIGRTRHRMVQMEIQEAGKRGAKLIELRLDYLAKAPDFKRLLEGKPCPIIATFRRKEDGGRWKGTEEERLMLIRQAVVAGFDYIDLEIDTIDKIRRFGKVKRIVSLHDFEDIPDDLEATYQKMCRLDADIVKIAVTPQKTSHNNRVLELMRDAPKPTVALGMGDLGMATRILNAKFGAPFTYAAFNPERSIAPGMIPFRPMKAVFRYEAIRQDTEVFGVIGDPVGHSLSPLVHNHAYKKLNLNAVYVPFRVPRGDLATFLDDNQNIPVRGYSVTIPHKEAAARLASWQHPDVARTRAANTLVFTSDGWKAFNTDIQAAVESLRAAAAIPQPDQEAVPLEKRTVLMLGAGGVARAIGYGLVTEGCQLILSNRTGDRATRLAAEIGCRTVDWEARHSVVCDTIINCTSVGMYPNVDESPVHNSVFKPGMLVFDTIYTPSTTMFLREAEERGCQILSGVDMFARQAGLQFKLFTGQEPPLEAMVQILKKALSPINYAKEEGKEET